MKALLPFEEFVRRGVIKLQAPDKSRAEFLMSESGQDYALLLDLVGKIKVGDRTANMFVKSCYDILMELIRARMILEGYNATGQGAHEAEVSYLRVLGFKESDLQFVDQMRFFRNGMLYYGTILDKVYAEKVLEFTKHIYPRLRQMIK